MRSVGPLLLLFLALSLDALHSVAAQEGYTCQISDRGMRVHESRAPTRYDCKDTNCANTCKGGQCVAYVKCRCSRGGRYPPSTSCWRPGTKLTLPNGRCNRNVPANTAIATFGSNGRYTQHAAVFISCLDDFTIRVYDQWCSRSVDYSNYPRSHRFYSAFSVITNSGCAEPTSSSCRYETAGGSSCPASVPGC
jgi:hypothetical protein